MKIVKLMLAAALACGTMSVASAAPAAERSQATEMRADGAAAAKQRDRDWRGDRRDDRRWRGDRGRHRGWYNRRVCRTVWRHHRRHRVCRMVRYRR